MKSSEVSLVTGVFREISIWIDWTSQDSWVSRTKGREHISSGVWPSCLCIFVLTSGEIPCRGPVTSMVAAVMFGSIVCVKGGIEFERQEQVPFRFCNRD